jgi:two-component system, OmpR family, phosphate regulon sensor histidine kinase PhoR
VTFGARLLLAIVTILVVTVGGAMLAADRWLRASIEHTLADEMRVEARLLGAALPDQPEQLAAAARRLSASANRRLTIVDSTGLVVGDSEFDDPSLALLDNHLARPEITEALATGSGVAKRYSNSTKRVELKVAVRAWPGVVRISAPMDQVDAIIADAQRGVFLAGLVALALGLMLAWVGEREVARPLGQLVTAARSVAAGRAPAYPATAVPEMRQLVRAFRNMQEELSGRMDELRRGREETAALLGSMVEGVIAVDPTGDVVFCNTALRRLLAYTDDEPLPNLRELFRQSDARQIVDAVLSGGAVLGRELTIDGRVVLVTARPLPTRGAVVCLHDITDLRRLEAVRRDFVANVSHELRTPLTSITGYAEILTRDAPHPKTAAQFLEVIRTNAVRMQHLVDDLLDLARLESGTWRPDVQRLDAGEVLRSAWAPYAERAAAADVGFNLAVADDARLHADPDALRQILTNLFDNALRHTPTGGRIHVEVTPADGGTELTVTDSGAGIGAEHLPRVFERFYRVDPARSRSQGGTGLGLSIVKHLVESHGARIDLTSALGRGTTIRMVFPHPSTGLS